MLYATGFMQYDKQYDIGNVLNILNMYYVQIRYAIYMCQKVLYSHCIHYMLCAICYIEYAMCNMQ
jgi:hypothetical protein